MMTMITDIIQSIRNHTTTTMIIPPTYRIPALPSPCPWEAVTQGEAITMAHQTHPITMSGQRFVTMPRVKLPQENIIAVKAQEADLVTLVFKVRSPVAATTTAPLMATLAKVQEEPSLAISKSMDCA
jgi:hypothetical protein